MLYRLGCTFLMLGTDGCEREDRVPLELGRGEITSRICKLRLYLAKLPVQFG